MLLKKNEQEISYVYIYLQKDYTNLSSKQFQFCGSAVYKIKKHGMLLTCNHMHL